MTLDGLDGDAKDLGYLGVAQPVFAIHREYLPASLRQPLNGSLNASIQLAGSVYFIGAHHVEG
jgi:hypothetical protein